MPAEKPLQDVAGNDAPSFSDQAVTNDTVAGGSDTTPPEKQSLSPAENATGVALDAEVSVTVVSLPAPRLLAHHSRNLR